MHTDPANSALFFVASTPPPLLHTAARTRANANIPDSLKYGDLPTNWDWRNVSGRDFTGPIRDQLRCGSVRALALPLESPSPLVCYAALHGLSLLCPFGFFQALPPPLGMAQTC